MSIVHDGMIDVSLRPKTTVGTVQDDPFDCWVEELLVSAFPAWEVKHGGKLTTPDLIVRDPVTGVLLGLEVKKLIQKPSGADGRGLTLDYNSCIPCGTTMIRVNGDTVQIPCFYLFCLLNPQSTAIVTLILMDGDFLNYDFNLHKEAKVANRTEYNHGPYGEGSVRHRGMYTYPNPLNRKLAVFHLRKTLVMKKFDAENLHILDRATQIVQRDDKYGNSFLYAVVDTTGARQATELSVIAGIFDACKKRRPKERSATMASVRFRKK